MSESQVAIQQPPEEENPDMILAKYKDMMAQCQNIATKMQEMTMEKDEHKLVIEQLSKLEGSRKAFRLVGEVLIERTVGEILPVVTTNFDGIKQIIDTLDATLKEKDQERRLYKEKHGIMTQEERDAVMKKSKAIKSA